MKSIEYKDTKATVGNDHSVITVISQQVNAGTHDEDALGTITVYGNLVQQSDPTVTQTMYGSYEKVAELGRRRSLRCGGQRVLPHGGTDMDIGNMAGRMASMWATGENIDPITARAAFGRCSPASGLDPIVTGHFPMSAVKREQLFESKHRKTRAINPLTGLSMACRVAVSFRLQCRTI